VIDGRQLEHAGGDDRRARGGSRPAHLGTTLGARLRALVALGLILLGALLLCESALADGEVSYTLGSSFKAEGACAMTEPNAAAVSESSGDVYVFDRATSFVSRFGPSGECLGRLEHGKAVKAITGVGGLAVDNSSSSPSFGDVYVEAEGGHAVDKFSPEGVFLSAVTNEFEAIHGVAVDDKGTLWVYQGKTAEETTLESFTDATTNAFVAAITLELSCAPRRGLEVGPNAESFYVGRTRENRKEGCENFPVAVKLNGAGETATEVTGPSGTPGDPAFYAQLDNASTSGTAVDQVTGEVFFDNGSSISAFSPTGLFVQRFGDEAGPGALQAGTGVAVDAASGTVYAVDAREGGVVDAFVPKSFEELAPGQGSGLPDGREWEQVSPVNKLGSTIYPISRVFGTVQASEDGNSITYTSNAPIVAHPPTNRAIEPAQNLSRRGASAWSTEDILPPGGPRPAGYVINSGTAYEAFSYDLNTAYLNPAEHETVNADEPLLSPEATETTPYRRDLSGAGESCEPTPSSCYVALVSPLDDATEVMFGAAHVKFANATPDAQHAVLVSSVALTPEGAAQGAGEGLYEWDAATHALKLVSVAPAGEKVAAEGEELELRLGGPGEGAGSIMRDAISTDGSRVIWSTGRGRHKLYLRDTVKGETIRLDLKQEVKTQPKGAHAVFQTASADGRRIFFTDVVPLTANATTENGEEAEEEAEARGEGDLYVCEVTEEAGTGKLGCNLRDLTAEVQSPNEEAAVQGVLGASSDGSYVYFVANAAFGKGAAGGCPQTEGAQVNQEREGLLPLSRCSLYVEHLNGESWEAPVFVAALSSIEKNDWFGGAENGGLVRVTSRVSPNGRYLAFMSNRSLTGYDNRDVNPAAKGARDEEVFLYDAQSKRLRCVSCKPGGASPQGVLDTERSNEGLGLLVDRSENWLKMWLAGSIPGWTARSIEGAVYQSRYLSDSGRLFFNSADALVPAAEGAVRKEPIEGKEASVGVENVYEYEADGEGSCTSATGCISLLSSGSSKQESTFLDASASGSGAFFLTSQPLVPAQDQDSGFDIYDARVCTTESPCLHPSGEESHPCSGEACKGPATSVPAAPAVPPSTQAGAGNVGSTVEVIAEKSESPPKPKARTLTRAQKLKQALKACKKAKRKNKRVACERQARRKYGPAKKGKK
jgi:DNA-binding beta-propeller fold protein YncE